MFLCLLLNDPKLWPTLTLMLFMSTSERQVLEEDSKKLEEFMEDWEDDDFSDNEEQLMIDLEKTSASTGESSFAGDTHALQNLI